MPTTPAAIADALARHPLQHVPALPGRTNHNRAGVLVPLAWTDLGLQAVLTLRSDDLRIHAGEVSWPGGRPEAQDADLTATALREADEEIGVRDATVLGRLSSVPLYTSDYRLEPVVAAVDLGQLAPDGVEVSRLLPISLTAALDAPQIDAQPFEWLGRTHLSPAWELAPGVICFGGTAHVLLELLQVVAPLLGKAVPPLVPGRWTWQQLLG